MQNKKNLIIIVGGAVVILLLSGGAFFLFKSTESKKAAAPVAQEDQAVPTLSPDAIGMTLSLISSGKFANNGVEMKISKISDISSIDYELDYTSKGDIPRGAIGHIDVKQTDATISQQLPFGTCSDVCHF